MPVAVIVFSPERRRGHASAGLMALLALFGGLRLGGAGGGHGRGAGQHGSHDVVIAGTAADVALKVLADHLLAYPSPTSRHDVDGGHDHAGRAEAALQAMMLAEG